MGERLAMKCEHGDNMVFPCAWPTCSAGTKNPHWDTCAPGYRSNGMPNTYRYDRVEEIVDGETRFTWSRVQMSTLYERGDRKYSEEEIRTLVKRQSGAGSSSYGKDGAVYTSHGRMIEQIVNERDRLREVLEDIGCTRPGNCGDHRGYCNICKALEPELEQETK